MDNIKKMKELQYKRVRMHNHTGRHKPGVLKVFELFEAVNELIRSPFPAPFREPF